MSARRYEVTVSPWFKVMRIWLPIAVVCTAACGLAYLETQQAYRANANDPQLQIAEDAAAAINSGATAQSVVGTGSIDISESLAPFVIVYGQDLKPIAGNGRLDGAIPAPPAGVFEYAADHGADRVTWQPRSGLRFAAVLMPIDDGRGGYVMAARSLREIELRIEQSTLRSGIAWGGAMLLSLIVIMVFTLVEERFSSAEE